MYAKQCPNKVKYFKGCAGLDRNNLSMANYRLHGWNSLARWPNIRRNGEEEL